MECSPLKSTGLEKCNHNNYEKHRFFTFYDEKTMEIVMPLSSIGYKKVFIKGTNQFVMINN